jgi:hypothetical protein
MSTSPTRQCSHCGLRVTAVHETREQCIDSLRDYIATVEFNLDALRDYIAKAEFNLDAGAKAGSSRNHNRGGYRERQDARWVFLDGIRMTLTEAARELGITASTLHFRILRRTHDAAYNNVDIRAIGADIARRPVRPCAA